MKPRLVGTCGMPAWWVAFWDYVQGDEWCAGAAHIFSAWAIVYTASSWLIPIWAAILFTACWSAPKELIFDAIPLGEGHGSPDWFDLLEYSIGVIVALLILWIRGIPLV